MNYMHLTTQVFSGMKLKKDPPSDSVGSQSLDVDFWKVKFLHFIMYANGCQTVFVLVRTVCVRFLREIIWGLRLPTLCAAL